MPFMQHLTGLAAAQETHTHTSCLYTHNQLCHSWGPWKRATSTVHHAYRRGGSTRPWPAAMQPVATAQKWDHKSMLHSHDTAACTGGAPACRPSTQQQRPRGPPPTRLPSCPCASRGLPAAAASYPALCLPPSLRPLSCARAHCALSTPPSLSTAAWLALPPAAP